MPSPPLRLPSADEDGVPFAKWLVEHEPNRQKRERVSVFLHQWDHLRDDLGRDPTVREYGREWNVPEAVAYRAARAFREVFEAEPGVICQLLWDGVAQQQGPTLLMQLDRVRVVPA